jgi:hypothetical protein
MSNNIFNGRRFILLWRQHFIQNTKLLLLATGAYIAVIFIILSLVQIGNDLVPHDFETFRGFMLGFVGIFGVIYVGHSFPAFRSKERSINYLMVPASVTEKFLFELISRIGIILVLLPFIFWVTFHLQGYFLSMFSAYVFEPIGIVPVSGIELTRIDEFAWLATMIISGVLLGFVLAFTGAAMFSKQPLIKTLFGLAVVMIFYFGFTYIVIEPLGVGKYNPPDSMWLLPKSEVGVFKFFSAALIAANLVMLFVAFRKLKEKEV